MIIFDLFRCCFFVNCQYFMYARIIVFSDVKAENRPFI